MEPWQKPAGRDALLMWISFVVLIFYIVSHYGKDPGSIWAVVAFIVGWYIYILLFLWIFRGTIGFLISGVRVIDATTKTRLSLSKSFAYSFVHGKRILNRFVRMRRLTGPTAFASNNVNEEQRLNIALFKV